MTWPEDGVFPGFTVDAVPVLEMPRESSHGSTTIPLPETVRPIAVLMRRLDFEPGPGREGEPGLVQNLRRLNGRKARYSRDAFGMFAKIRMLNGIADLLIDNNQRGEAQLALQRAANDLYRHVLPWATNPLPHTHRDYIDRLHRAAQAILDLFMDPQTSHDIRAFREDETCPGPIRASILRLLGQSMSSACAEVADSLARHEREMRDMIAGGLESPDHESALGPMIEAAEWGNQFFGPAGLLVDMLLIVAKWDIVRMTGARSEMPTIAQQLYEFAHYVAGMSESEISTFRQHLEDHDEDAAEEMFQHHFHGPIVSSIAAVVSIFGFYHAMHEAMEHMERGTFDARDVLSTASAGLGMSRETLEAVHAVGSSFAGHGHAAHGAAAAVEGEAAAVSRAAASLRFINDLVHATADVVAVAGAVSSIVEGGYTISNGWAEDNGYEVGVGTAQVASGLAICAGVMIGIPGAQPVGVALALATEAVEWGHGIWEESRGGLVLYDRLIHSLRHTRSAYTGNPLSEDAGLTEKIEALERAAGELTCIAYDPRYFAVSAVDQDQFNHEVARAMRQRLVDLGVSAHVAHQLVVDPAAWRYGDEEEHEGHGDTSRGGHH